MEEFGLDDSEAFRMMLVRFLDLRKSRLPVRGYVRKGWQADDFLTMAFKSESPVFRYQRQLMKEGVYNSLFNIMCITSNRILRPRGAEIQPR